MNPTVGNNPEATAAWDMLIGDRAGADDMAWWNQLTARATVLDDVKHRISDERATIAARWHAGGESFAVIGQRVGLTRARAQQLVERGRKLRSESREEVNEPRAPASPEGHIEERQARPPDTRPANSIG